MDYYSVLKRYTELPGPGGHEERVQKEFMNDLKPYTDEIEYTNIGNVVAHLPGEGRKVVIFGHADEIGYFVRSITEDGFLRLSRGRIGRIGYPYSLVGQKALVVGDEGDIRGVFISTAGHVLSEKEREAPLEVEKVFVDIGAASKEEAEEKGIHPGTPIIWNPETERMGDRVFGKAMDDRFTYPVMLGLAESIKGKDLTCDLYLASTILEEYGLRGASNLAHMGFDVSIALDIGIAGDYPSVPKGRMPVKLGKGPVMAYRDGAIIYNVKTIRELVATAERNGIPYQQAVFEHYGSDSVAMIAGGARPCLVATPTRYSHSPFEMMDLGDIEQTVKLLSHYVTEEQG
ncbi:MAG TPA: M42 family peptidase [Patescibacteria group bacterium]|nr:M42 family peptidase [Patescibacteria group bacterium]